MSETEFEPRENGLSIEQLRREVRDAWELQNELRKALMGAPEFPPGWVLSFLGGAGRYPEDWEAGKRAQLEHGLDAVPPKTECEIGAGVWLRIRRGLLTPSAEGQES